MDLGTEAAVQKIELDAGKLVGFTAAEGDGRDIRKRGSAKLGDKLSGPLLEEELAAFAGRRTKASTFDDQ